MASALQLRLSHEYGLEHGMVQVVFFVAFGLAGLHLILSAVFLNKIKSLDDEVVEDRYSVKNTKLLMKYIFFFKKSEDFPSGLMALLALTRVVFLLGWSSYLLLLSLIIFK